MALSRQKLVSLKIAAHYKNYWPQDWIFDFTLAAIRDFYSIIKNVQDRKVRAHDYQLGLTYMWLGRSLTLLNSEQINVVKKYGITAHHDYYFEKALTLHKKVLIEVERTYFLQKVIDSYYDKKNDSFKTYSFQEAKKKKIDFVTIE